MLSAKTKAERAFRKGAMLSLSVLSLSVLGLPAHANLISDGSFTTLATDSFIATSSTIPPWIVANTASTTNPLTCVVVTTAGDYCGKTYFGGANFWVTPAAPTGDSYLVSDANPAFAQTISQTVTGLTVGKTYTVSFDEGGANVFGDGAASTESWAVTFGGVTETSATVTAPANSDAPFIGQTLSFTANSATETLSFLASGTPVGGPPMALLANVDVEVAVPEPASFALFGIAVLGLLALSRTRTRSSAVV
jgi:hypothetical protein